MDIDKLSTKEREALLHALSAKKKQEETARRKNYQKMRTRFISSVEKRLRKYVKDGQALRLNPIIKLWKNTENWNVTNNWVLP